MIGNGTAHNSTTPSPVPSPQFDIFLGSVYVICGMLGIPANLAAFSYFSRNRNFSNVLYCMINVTDAMICAISLPLADIFLNERREGAIFGNRVLCYIWTLLWSLLNDFSLLLILVLSGVRIWILVRPFQRINPHYVTLGMILYMLYPAGYIVYLLSDETTRVSYISTTGCCSINVSDSNLRVNALVWLTSMLAPVVAVVCSSVAMLCLVKRTRKSMRDGLGNLDSLIKSRIHATITVVMFATVYFVISLPNIMYSFDVLQMFVVSFFKTPKPIFGAVSNLILIYNYLGLAINSTLNPVIYYGRMEGFRKFLSSCIIQSM